MPSQQILIKARFFGFSKKLFRLLSLAGISVNLGTLQIDSGQTLILVRQQDRRQAIDIVLKDVFIAGRHLIGPRDLLINGFGLLVVTEKSNRSGDVFDREVCRHAYKIFAVEHRVPLGHEITDFFNDAAPPYGRLLGNGTLERFQHILDACLPAFANPLIGKVGPLFDIAVNHPNVGMLSKLVDTIGNIMRIDDVI